MEQKKLEAKQNITGYPSIDRPWLKYYSEEAIQVPLPEGNMYDYLWECNKAHLSDVALVYFGRRITYRKLFSRIDQIARALVGRGIKAGDVVSILSLNTPEAICTHYALNKVGAVACMEYVTQTPESLSESLKSADVKLIFILDIFYSNFVEVLFESNIPAVVMRLTSSMGYPNKMAALLKQKKYRRTKKIISFQDFLRVNVTIPLESTSSGSSASILLSTSGTTGIPKKVVHSSFNINSVVFQYQMSGMVFRRGETYLSMAPLFMAFGITLAIHLPLCLGVSSIICLNPDAKKTIAMFAKYRPNHFLCGDYHMMEMCSNPAIVKMDLTFLRTVAIGGESLSPENVSKVNVFLQKHHSSVNLITGYGMTELGATVITEMNGAQRIGSVGIPQNRVNIRVIDSETGEEKRYDEVGEILIHAPSMMLKYWKNSQATDDAVETDDEGRKWIHTGDLGRVDMDGFVYIQGRIKRIYQRLMPGTGTIYKVFPDYIEQSLSRHPAVNYCAVVCIDHDKFITIPVAFVIPENGLNGAEILEQDLLDYVGSQIGDYNVPTRCIFKTELPLLPNGKIDYRALEKELKGDTLR